MVRRVVGLLLTFAAVVAAHADAQPQSIPSVAGLEPPPQSAAAAARARSMVRATIQEQNLPGVSVAVGAGTRLVWTEGFGWRDVITRAPVTPETRFVIGTAAPVVAAAAPPTLDMHDTGAEPAAEWSPGHIGEPEEDFPVFTFIHDVILRRLGLASPAQPLPGNRATVYVPSTRWRGDATDPRLGRRLIYMRDLATCADGKACYSTPSDLVRFALATKAGSFDGELAGGTVVSLAARRDAGIAVAVASNVAHAGTAALARQIADLFAGGRR